MLVVHGGCGKVSKEKNLAIKKLFKQIGEKSLEHLKQRTPAMEICTQAVVQMENSGILNAGCGGSLTHDGILENEAAVMCGKSGLFGGVSCATSHPNPVVIARQLVINQLAYNNNNSFSSQRLIPPQHLCGMGVENFATRSHLKFDLIKPSYWAKKNYNQFKKFIQDGLTNNDDEWGNIPMDTVGAICVDCDGNMAVAASSGGRLLRESGRIGHVALASGSGIWVTNNTSACCVTGIGEQLAKLNFARTLLTPNNIPIVNLNGHDTDNDLDEHYNTFNHFIANGGSNNKKLPAGALIVENYRDKSRVKVSWIHSTHSMPVSVTSLKKGQSQYYDNINNLYQKIQNSPINVVYI